MFKVLQLSSRPTRAITILVICFCISSSVPGLNLPEQPNVLLILVDDLNDCTGYQGGHPQTLTPSIDRLAASGASFKRAYTNAPMCGPSRSSMLLGIYPHHSQNFFQAPWFRNEVLNNTRTLMEQFKMAGYNVMGSGKILHHNKQDIWTSFANPADYGPSPFDGEKKVPHPDVPSPFRDMGWVDGSLGPFINLDGRLSREGKPLNWTTGDGRQGYTPMRYVNDDDRDPTPDEQNASWAASTLGVLAEQESDQPFFLAVGFLRPHTPLVAPQKYFDRFPLDQLELSTIKPGDEEDTHLVASYQGEVFTLSIGKRMHRAISESYGSTEEGLKRWTQAYLACVAAVDDNIGKVMDALDSSPLRENTIVVLVSDHGFHMGEKDYLYKNSLWEESTRVPLLMRVPGLTREGSEIQHPVGLIHIYPTLLDLCSLSFETVKNEKGHPLDGHSMRSLLQNPDAKTWTGPEAALTAVYAGDEFHSDPAKQHYAIRTQRYRYIRYNTGLEELYDHKKDPYEWENLAPRKKRILEKMRALLTASLSH